MTERHPQRQLHTQHKRAASVMSSGKAIPTEPTYFRALREVGLIPKDCSFAEAFRVWTIVARDPIVLVYEKRIKEKHPNNFNRNQITQKALMQLAESTAEMTQLRIRIENRSEEKRSDHAADVSSVA
jgi:hypothetical protein